MKRIILVTGGERSGKSSYAERMALSLTTASRSSTSADGRCRSMMTLMIPTYRNGMTILLMPQYLACARVYAGLCDLRHAFENLIPFGGMLSIEI